MDDAGFKVTPLKTAAAFLLLSLIPLGAGYVRAHQVRADVVAFAREGVQTVGTVVNKTSEFIRNSMRYTVYFEYKDRSGVTYQESSSLPSSDSFDDYRIGGPITLTYLSSRPEHFYLPVDTPTEKYAHIFDIMFYIGLAGTVASLGAIALFWGGGSGGETRLAPQPISLPRSMPDRPRPVSGPPTFGRR